jgi:hypothetical protein
VPECGIVPVAHRYEYRREEKARALMQIGAPFPARDLAGIPRRDAKAAIQAALTSTADALRDCLLADRWEPFETVLAGSPPLHHPVDRIKRVFNIGQVQRQSRRAG